MKTEFEITFSPVNREEIREKVQKLWGSCIMKNTLMKRTVFNNSTKNNSYVRVRDEWNKITCTYKEISDWKLDIHSVKELETEVQDYEIMVRIFQNLWMKQKSVQESYRETWSINNEIEIMIDEWPWMKPFIEIEGKNEEVVKKYTEKLWFSWGEWIFGTVVQVYKKELWTSEDVISNLEIITFDNPPKL